MKDALESGDKIKVVGFGNLEVKLKKVRKGKNPRGVLLLLSLVGY